MMELEASLTALKEEKKLVQDRLAAYAYPCPAPIGILSPHLLCQICRKWRDIALTTPALWRAGSLTLRAPDRLEQAVCLLESSLARSGSRLLSIELKDNSTVDMSQFCRIIADYRARCEHLALSINKPFALLPTSHPSLPFLRTLKLGWPGQVTPTVLAAPLLQKVDINGYLSSYRSIFPWSQITVLSVRAITTKECASLLPQLVNIVYCCLDVNEDGDTDWSVILTHLETLILRSPAKHVQEFLLGTLTLPAL
ncbi:hypothetical protein DFH06DRAFT_1467852 [Mycena polygramma]|nr:hypothetical protein DFH06DRAFT_1467852 [Mycena polygramma]